jgi:hypothetical protein
VTLRVEYLVTAATRLNNDADADAPQGLEAGKVENLCRTATAQKILPAHPNKSDHACAIPWAAEAKPARSRTARRNVKT